MSPRCRRTAPGAIIQRVSGTLDPSGYGYPWAAWPGLPGSQDRTM
jgi:hypothetical protein